MPNESEFDDQQATSGSETNESLSRELSRRPTTEAKPTASRQSQVGGVLATDDDDEDCTWATGEQARCNCSGRRRSTLAGLIELFEQKAHVVDTGELNLPRPATAKVNKQRARDQMRNIITPVNYDDQQQQSDGERTDPTARRQRVSIKGVPVLPQPDLKTLTATNWRQASDTYSCKSSHSRSSRRRPPAPIVRHQTSSSRRLLGQLARLRRLSEPNYRVRRPEKVAQVEALIDQLERATAGWDEDERLLDRAELRDLPADFQRRQQSQAGQPPAATTTDFGLRLDVNPSEVAAIERSHSQLFGDHMDTWSARSTLSRPSSSLSAQADRYLDDLAVRRLGGLSPASGGAEPAQHRHQMSYLLCSNAYTPTVESGASEWELLEEERARNDDLHYRSLTARNRLAPHEPPFGIPRQVASHSSASHYLRRVDATSRTCTPNSPSLAHSDKTQTQLDPSGRNSRVSFKVEPSRTSADSGRPLSTAGSTPTGYYDDATQEVELDEELLLAADQLELERILAQPTAESPSLERHTASVSLAPSRRRPKISIENPRTKSPLLHRSDASLGLKVARQPASQPSAVKIQCYDEQRPVGELECHYDFGIELDDEQSELDEPIVRSSSRASRLISTDDTDWSNTRRNSSENNDSSIERLDYRAGSTPQTGGSEQVTFREPKNKSVAFSIGQYSSLNKPNLKIL